MKTKKLRKKITASVRAHYVRKKDHDQLKDEVKALRKRLALLEKRCVGADDRAPPGEAESSAAQDDLKQIKGIGPVLETKLHALGITRYAQIAAWTAADIDRVSEQLDFKGRIEREGWVEQAAVLVK